MVNDVFCWQQLFESCLPKRFKVGQVYTLYGLIYVEAPAYFHSCYDGCHDTLSTNPTDGRLS